MLNIVEVLNIRGLKNSTSRIKMIRHLDRELDLLEFMLNGHLETYQKIQAKPVFDNCDFLVSFIGLPRLRARLLGVYKVGIRTNVHSISIPSNYPAEVRNEYYYYDLEKVLGFEDLEERVIIDWGKSAKMWHQWLVEKEVVEILPQGYTRPFPGYYDFILSYDELLRIVQSPDTNREWHLNLSAVAGIYLIVHSSTGNQYIGSAYGSGGIIKRWATYTESGHGNNIRLKNLMASYPNAYREFRFSILRTLPKDIPTKEVIKYENFYKEKLGSRTFGLNAN